MHLKFIKLMTDGWLYGWMDVNKRQDIIKLDEVCRPPYIHTFSTM